MPAPARKLKIRNVSGEVAASIDYSASDTGRSIKESIHSATGGRVKLMSLLYKDELLGDSTQLSSLGISDDESLTLVSKSAAELVRLPNFNGMYFGTLSNPDGYSIIIDSAEFEEVDSSFGYYCRGAVHLVKNPSIWSRLFGRDSDSIPIRIDICGTLEPTGTLLLKPFGFTGPVGPAEFPQLCQPDAMALHLAADGSVVLLHSATFEEIMLTRASDTEVADLDPTLDHMAMNFRSKDDARSHLQRLIREFAHDAVGPGIAALMKQTTTDRTDVIYVLRMDRKLSRIDVIQPANDTISMSILFKDVDSLEKDCVSTSALHCVSLLDSGVHNKTTFIFDSTHERDRAYSCFKILQLVAQGGSEMI